MGPDLTIVVPTAGDVDSLSGCLRSLLDQSALGSTPILIVDNGARPLSDVPSLSGYWRQGIRVVREPRRGVAFARNVGLRAARTDWVVFTDDDCTAPGDWLERLRGYLSANPDIQIAGGLVEEPDRAGMIYGFMRRLNYMRSKETLKSRHAGIPSLGGANLACRRAEILAIGGFDETLVSTEDYELLIRCHANGHRIGLYSDVPRVCHRHTTDLRRFVKRYRSYGFGVAQTLAKHPDLDPEAHRVYARRGSPRSVLGAAARFAREDLEVLGDDRQPMDRALTMLRALAFQYGAWRAMG